MREELSVTRLRELVEQMHQRLAPKFSDPADEDRVSELELDVASRDREIAELKKRLGPIDPGGSDKIDELEEAISNLRASNAQLWGKLKAQPTYRDMVVWCYSEDGQPEYLQGSNGEHEICEPVTAEEVNYFIKRMGEMNTALGVALGGLCSAALKDGTKELIEKARL